MGEADRNKGLYKKFFVHRVDRRDMVGDKHYQCDYFVLDLTHDRHAVAALTAYAESCAEDYPFLSEDLWKKIEHLMKKGGGSEEV